MALPLAAAVPGRHLLRLWLPLCCLHAALAQSSAQLGKARALAALSRSGPAAEAEAFQSGSQLPGELIFTGQELLVAPRPPSSSVPGGQAPGLTREDLYALLEYARPQEESEEQPVVLKVDGGEDAPPGRFPYMCSLRDPMYNRMFCAGTLIHPELVLTAAHCLGKSTFSFDIRDIAIICGDYQLSADNGTDIRRMRDFALHPNWSERRRGSDIGLVWLDAPANNTPTVQVISPEEWQRVGVPGQEFTGVGWGRVNLVEKAGERARYPIVLQQFKAPLINTSRCNEPEVYGGKVDDTMICVGWLEGSGPSSCKGDSGGPMLYAPAIDDPASHRQVGIVSWSGESCGTPESPDVHTKVAAFHEWIQKAIAEVEAP